MLKVKLILMFVCQYMVLNVIAKEDQHINWNDAELAWFSYQEGIDELKKNKGVGLFIIYADWCPTCKAYSKLFKNPAVVKSLQGIILIRANMDNEPLINEQYNRDGKYVPRTFALDSSGQLIKPLHPDKQRYDYFLPVEKPRYVVNFATQLKAYHDNRR